MQIETVRNETYTVIHLIGQFNTEASETAGQTLLEEFRNGKIGKVTLENIQSQEQ